MPDPAYRVAREAAQRLSKELQLTPPFDVERLAATFALVLDEEIPTRADVVVLHGARSGELPRIVVDAGLADNPERRRFAVAHGLGHVLLGWHPFHVPCDVSVRPVELPVTVHDLVEGEASAFARELLMPSAWIESFDATDRPALLARHVADRAGQPIMPAARSVAQLLDPGWVWCVTDRWNRVVDAGRSPGTDVCPPHAGDDSDLGPFARHASERQRSERGGMTLTLWRFERDLPTGIRRDPGSHELARTIATELDPDADPNALVARMEGIAGWANEQHGTDSLDGMRVALDARARSVPELVAASKHPQFGELLDAKATELVARRLAR